MYTTARANFVLNKAAQLQKSHDFNSAILVRLYLARNTQALAYGHVGHLCITDVCIIPGYTRLIRFGASERLINFKYKKNGFTKEYKRKIKPIGFRTIKKDTR